MELKTSFLLMHIQHLVKQYLTMIKWLDVTMQDLYDDC